MGVPGGIMASEKRVMSGKEREWCWGVLGKGGHEGDGVALLALVKCEALACVVRS